MAGEEVPSQVLLKVKDVQFSCDRQLLANHSQYFHAMFNNDFRERHQEHISLQGVEPEAFEFIINTIVHETPIDFTKSHNLLDVLEASRMLQFDLIQNECIQFIVCSWMDLETWLPTAIISDRLGLTDLKQKTRSLALWHFSDVRKTQKFLHLSLEEVLDYLSDDRLRTTDGEFEVFEAGVNWIEFNPEDRLFYSLHLLRVVRFKEMKTFDIGNMLHFSSVKDTPQAELIVECILEIKDDILNKSCRSCNPPTTEEEDSLESGKSSPLPTGMFFKNIKRKRRTTSHCTCYDSTTLKEAQELLEKESRCLPLIPCVAASFPFSKPACDESPRVKFREKSKRPYVFQWDGVRLSPFIHLLKIDEGVSEAVGYKIVAKDFKLYVIGGEYMMGQGDWNTSVWFYDTTREIWQFETSLPSPRRHHAAVCVNDDIYIIGGVGRHRVMLDTVAKYNLITKSWDTCVSLPTPLYSTACCVYNEDIYVFGPQVYCYRQAVAGWESLTHIMLPDNMAVSAAMTVGDSIYITGFNAKLYCFVPQLEEVEIRFIGQFKLAGTNACTVNNSIISFAEEDSIQTVEEYDLTKKEFNTLWYHKREDEAEVEGCILNQSGGCFALPKYY